MQQTANNVLWAVKVGAPDYCEELITDKPERIEQARMWAAANGFDRFRLSTVDLATAPNFSNTVKS